MKLTKSKLKQIIKEEYKNILSEATQYGIEFSNNDHYTIDKSFEKAGIEGGVGWAENFDIYGWNDKGNYLNAVKELNAMALKTYKPYYMARQKLDDMWKQKDKIFKKHRKTDGSRQGD